MSQRDDPVSAITSCFSMAKLKQICDRLAFSVDLPPIEIPCFARAFRRSGI
jgi:hypothetical protein